MTTLRSWVALAGALAMTTGGCGKANSSTERDQKAISIEANRFANFHVDGDAETESQLADIKEELVRSSKLSANAMKQEALTPGVIDFAVAAIVKKIRPLLMTETTKVAAEIAGKAEVFFTYDELRQINAYSQTDAARSVRAAIRKASRPWPTTSDGRPVPYSIGIKQYESDLPPGRLVTLSDEDLRLRQRFIDSPANARLGAFIPVLGEIRHRRAAEFVRSSAPIVSQTMAEARSSFLKQTTVER